MGIIADDDLTIRLRAIGSERTEHDIREVRREVEHLDHTSGTARANVRGLGEDSEGSARKVGLLGRAMKSFRAEIAFGGGRGSGGGGVGSTSRLSLPGGLSIPGLPVPIAIAGFGAAVNAIPAVTSAIVGLTEATASVVGGGAGAGGVGLLALGQTIGTVTLASQGLSQALAGNADAYARLTPAQQRFVDQLESMRPMLDDLRDTAARGFLPGVGAGLTAAARNFPVLRSIVGDTSRTLGGLARQAGQQVGSATFGRDLGTLGRTNVHIIRDLGEAGLSLADAARHILVEAGPLAEWLARNVREGARLIDVWAGNARAGGDLRRFFRGARTDLSLLFDIFQHTGRGILNLFRAPDVSGTRTLRGIDRIAARFERWTRSPAVRHGLGDALVAQIPGAISKVVDLIAINLAKGAPTAARIFWDAFWGTNIAGKAGILGLLALKGGGIGGLLGGIGAIGKGLGGAAGLTRGSSPKNPLWVAVVNDLPGGKDLITKLLRGGKGLLGVGLGTGLGVLGGTVAGAIAIDKGITALKGGRRDERPLSAGGRNVQPNTPAARTIQRTRDRYERRDRARMIAANTQAYQGYQGIPGPRAHLHAVMPGEPPRRRHGKPPDIVIHSHVHTNDREIGKATGRYTWREDDRR